MKKPLYDVLNAAEVIHVDGEPVILHTEKLHGGAEVVGLCESPYGYSDPRWVSVDGNPLVELHANGFVLVNMFDTDNDPDCEYPEEAEQVQIDLFMLRTMQLTDI